MEIPDNWKMYDEDDKKYKVYCLRHPVNNNILYIGCTKRNLISRIKDHYSRYGISKKEKYLIQLQNKGMYPNIEILYKFSNKIAARIVENLLINFVKRFVNPNLLNKHTRLLPSILKY